MEGATTGKASPAAMWRMPSVRLNPAFAVTGVRGPRRAARCQRRAQGHRHFPGRRGRMFCSASVFHQQEGTFLMNVFPGRYRIVPGLRAGLLRGVGDARGTRCARTRKWTWPPAPAKNANQLPVQCGEGSRHRGELRRRIDVYIVPQDEAFLNDQFIRSGRCDSNGRFEMDSLRPGSYYAFAFDRVDFVRRSRMRFRPRSGIAAPRRSR